MQKFPTFTMVSISCPTFAREAPEVCMVPYGLVAQVPCSRCSRLASLGPGCKLHGTSWDLRWKRYQDDSRWLKMTQNSTQIRLGVSFCFFPRAFERRVLLLVGVCQTFSHLHVCTSHLLIFTFSHPHITSSHLLIFTSSHLHILTS